MKSGNLNFWNPLDHSRPVMGLLYLYLFTTITTTTVCVCVCVCVSITDIHTSRRSPSFNSDVCIEHRLFVMRIYCSVPKAVLISEWNFPPALNDRDLQCLHCACLKPSCYLSGFLLIPSAGRASKQVPSKAKESVASKNMSVYWLLLRDTSTYNVLVGLLTKYNSCCLKNIHNGQITLKNRNKSKRGISNSIATLLATVAYLPLGGDRAQWPRAHNSKSGGAVAPKSKKAASKLKKKIKRNLGCSGMGPTKWAK
jgi:hypothetical protein